MIKAGMFEILRGCRCGATEYEAQGNVYRKEPAPGSMDYRFGETLPVVKCACGQKFALEYIGQSVTYGGNKVKIAAPVVYCATCGMDVPDGTCPDCAPPKQIKTIPGIDYTFYRIPGEEGPHARMDSFYCESGPDDDGLYTFMRSSGPLHGQRFRAGAAGHGEPCKSVYDRRNTIDGDNIGPRKTARELAAELGCTPEMVSGARPEPVATRGGHYPNNTYVRVFDLGSPSYGQCGRIVNAAQSVGVQAFVLLDNSAFAQEFHISQIEEDARYTPEQIEQYRAKHNAIGTLVDDALTNAGAAITVAEEQADATIDLGVVENFIGGDTITASAHERLILSRFLDHLEGQGYVIGEYGKSEGGGSPLTPVESATEVLETYLRPIRRSVAR